MRRKKTINSQPTLFIMITNNCNLKCAGCMQSCDRIKKPFYLELNDLKKYLYAIKNKTLTINGKMIKTIHITGGEPLTHPNFIEICQTIKNILPEYTLDMSTNGLFLYKFSDEQLINLFKKYNIHIQLSIYPKLSLLKMYKNIAQRLTKLNLAFSFDGGSRFYFTKQEKIINNLKNSQYGYEYLQCKNTLKNCDYVTLIKDRIYICQREVNYISRQENIIDDSISVFNLQNNQEFIQLYKRNICEICDHIHPSTGQNFLLWHPHPKNANLIFEHNFEDLFLNYYDIYYDLQHNCKDNYSTILKDDLFQQYFFGEQKHYANTRFLNGEGDIFIPISKTDIQTLKNLKNFLTQQKNIFKYNIYFISINNTKELETFIYKTFTPFYSGENLNCYLLKANNLFKAYQIFFKNSFLSKKYIINLTKHFEIKEL